MIHIFLGTKAQLIKMAPIMRELQNREVPYNFIFSGQHQATIKDIREEFGVKEPDISLYNGKDITGILQMLVWSLRIALYILLNKNKVWQSDKKGIVLNHGDTLSTLIGALTARLCGLQCGHVESGLRSFNIFHPFPEEIIRRLTFRLSNVFFAPGDWAIDNLKKYKGVKINTTHNTLIDALEQSQKTIDSTHVDIPTYTYGIVSIHRFENIFSPRHLLNIVEQIEIISKSYPLLFILHKPTLKKLHKHKLYDRLNENPNIELRPRYSYFQFIKLVKASLFVVTDGGSNQEECYYLGKPCLIMRKATERQEGIKSNALLCMFEKKQIENFINNIKTFSLTHINNKLSPTKIITNHLIYTNEK